MGRDHLVHLGSCIGKLTHSGKFRLTIGALDILAQFAKHKVRLGAGGGVALLPWRWGTPGQE